MVTVANSAAEGALPLPKHNALQVALVNTEGQLGRQYSSLPSWFSRWV